ncbi:MAG: transposase [Candidatus Aenigmatarchaeota archaeon]
MNVFDLLSSEEACSRLFRSIRWVNSIHCPRCGSIKVKGHGNYKRFLKRYFCKACKRTFNDKTGTIFHYSRLSFREWFTIMLLFLGLHNSCYGLSWLLGRSKMTIFKALKKLMLKLRNKIELIKFKGTIEIDELYINAGLKGRNNSIRIKHLGRVAKKRAFRKHGMDYGIMISLQYLLLLIEIKKKIIFLQVMLNLKQSLRL